MSKSESESPDFWDIEITSDRSKNSERSSGQSVPSARSRQSNRGRSSGKSVPGARSRENSRDRSSGKGVHGARSRPSSRQDNVCDATSAHSGRVSGESVCEDRPEQRHQSRASRGSMRREGSAHKSRTSIHSDKDEKFTVSSGSVQNQKDENSPRSICASRNTERGENSEQNSKRNSACSCQSAHSELNDKDKSTDRVNRHGDEGEKSVQSSFNVQTQKDNKSLPAELNTETSPLHLRQNVRDKSSGHTSRSSVYSEFEENSARTSRVSRCSVRSDKSVQSNRSLHSQNDRKELSAELNIEISPRSSRVSCQSVIDRNSTRNSLASYDSDEEIKAIESSRSFHGQKSQRSSIKLATENSTRDSQDLFHGDMEIKATKSGQSVLSQQDKAESPRNTEKSPRSSRVARFRAEIMASRASNPSDDEEILTPSSSNIHLKKDDKESSIYNNTVPRISRNSGEMNYGNDSPNTDRKCHFHQSEDRPSESSHASFYSDCQELSARSNKSDGRQTMSGDHDKKIEDMKLSCRSNQSSRYHNDQSARNSRASAHAEDERKSAQNSARSERTDKTLSVELDIEITPRSQRSSCASNHSTREEQSAGSSRASSYAKIDNKSARSSCSIYSRQDARESYVELSQRINENEWEPSSHLETSVHRKKDDKELSINLDTENIRSELSSNELIKTRSKFPIENDNKKEKVKLDSKKSLDENKNIVLADGSKSRCKIKSNKSSIDKNKVLSIKNNEGSSESCTTNKRSDFTVTCVEHVHETQPCSVSTTHDSPYLEIYNSIDDIESRENRLPKSRNPIDGQNPKPLPRQVNAPINLQKSPYEKKNSSSDMLGCIKLPVIDGNRPVQLTRTKSIERNKFNKTVKEKSIKENTKQEKQKKEKEVKTKQNGERKTRSMCGLDKVQRTKQLPVTLPPIGAPLSRKKAMHNLPPIDVPTKLKTQALYHNGQLELAITDEQKMLRENQEINVKVTVLHQFPNHMKPKMVNPPRKRDIDGKSRSDPDILEKRAMFPPFNTYVDTEASNRFKRQYGLK